MTKTEILIPALMPLKTVIDHKYVSNVCHEKGCQFIFQAELLEALDDLVKICGEATIPMVNSHAVRKMAKFMAAIDRAKTAISKIKACGETQPQEKP